MSFLKRLNDKDKTGAGGEEADGAINFKPVAPKIPDITCQRQLRETKNFT